MTKSSNKAMAIPKAIMLVRKIYNLLSVNMDSKRSFIRFIPAY